MGSETPLQLPFIDLSNQNKNTNTALWDETKTRVRQALEHFGCFEATFGDISSDLQADLFDAMKQLFDFPLETKLSNKSSKPYHGYDGQYPKTPLYESMGIDEAPVPGKAESFAKIWWPDGNPKFCKTIQEFSEKLANLDKMVRTMVLESLGLDKYVDEHLGSTNYLLRFIKYRVPEGGESDLGLNSHTDSNFLTILRQNEVGGLEVQDKFGNWIKFQPSTPYSFLVMNGDSIYAYTNGRLHPPFHQVTINENKERYSLGFFATPKNGYIVKAPEELVDEEHPLLFKPYDLGDFLKFYDHEVYESPQAALKVFCAV